MTGHDQESQAPAGRLFGGPSFASRALNLLPADSKASGDWPDLYGPLIGSWTVESSFVGPDGATRRANGEWHFERILGGMGVQDVLFAEGSQPEQYGTSLRVVDTRTGLWHVVWMQPGSGEFVALVGRANGDGIVHEGHPLDDPQGPRQRWIFTGISRTSFTWTGDSSNDGGVSWSLEQTMLGTRREDESGQAEPDWDTSEMNALLVEVTMSSLDRHTRLRLLHTGLDGGAPRHLHDDGWSRFLARLHAAMGDEPAPEYPTDLPADRLPILTRDD